MQQKKDIKKKGMELFKKKKCSRTLRGLKVSGKKHWIKKTMKVADGWNTFDIFILFSVVLETL